MIGTKIVFTEPVVDLGLSGVISTISDHFGLIVDLSYENQKEKTHVML